MACRVVAQDNARLAIKLITQTIKCKCIICTDSEYEGFLGYACTAE